MEQCFPGCEVGCAHIRCRCNLSRRSAGMFVVKTQKHAHNWFRRFLKLIGIQEGCKSQVMDASESAKKTIQQLYKISTPCIDDHHFKGKEMKSVGELSQVCSQNVIKC